MRETSQCFCCSSWFLCFSCFAVFPSSIHAWGRFRTRRKIPKNSPHWRRGPGQSRRGPPKGSRLRKFPASFFAIFREGPDRHRQTIAVVAVNSATMLRGLSQAYGKVPTAPLPGAVCAAARGSGGMAESSDTSQRAAKTLGAGHRHHQPEPCRAESGRRRRFSESSCLAADGTVTRTTSLSKASLRNTLLGDDFGIHQVVYRWARRLIDAKQYREAIALMDLSVRHWIYAPVPGRSPLMIDSLMWPEDAADPKTFADFEVARHIYRRAHEIYAAAYAGFGRWRTSNDASRRLKDLHSISC